MVFIVRGGVHQSQAVFKSPAAWEHLSEALNIIINQEIQQKY